MYNTDEVIEKIRANRAATKASLAGMERMQYNLRWKLRNWILRETGRRCVCVGEVVDKVRKYSPKAILSDREQFEKAVKDIWSIAHDYGIDSDDMLREDLNECMNSIFGKDIDTAVTPTSNTGCVASSCQKSKERLIWDIVSEILDTHGDEVDYITIVEHLDESGFENRKIYCSLEYCFELSKIEAIDTDVMNAEDGYMYSFLEPWDGFKEAGIDEAIKLLERLLKAN